MSLLPLPKPYVGPIQGKGDRPLMAPLCWSGSRIYSGETDPKRLKGDSVITSNASPLFCGNRSLGLCFIALLKIAAITIFSILYSGCAASKKFQSVDSSKVGVVIGYKIVSRDSVHPAVRSLLIFGGGATAAAVQPATGAAVLAASEGTQIVASKEAEKTVRSADGFGDEINALLFEDIEKILNKSGYSVSLIKTSPIEYKFLKDDFGSAENYYSHVYEFYNLDAQALQAIDVDIILYLEYEIKIYVPKDEKDIGSEILVDDLWGTVFAFTKPPNSIEIYRNPVAYTPLLSRMSPSEAVKMFSSDLQEWSKR